METNHIATDPHAPHAYVRTPGTHTWRTCDVCGRGANAEIHRSFEGGSR